MKKFIKLLRLIRMGFFPDLLKHKVAAGIEHRAVLEPLDCMHVVDIGANRGQFALMARKCFPQARIDSFEPLTGPGDLFQSLFSNDPLVNLHRCAIGPDKGEATIHVSNRDDSSSLLPITQQQSTLFPGTEEREKETISVTPLTDVITKDEILSPAMLKLDVQGFELEALLGCRSLLQEFKYVYVECSFIELYKGQAFADEIINFLQSNDFVLSGIYSPRYDNKGRSIQADFFFVARV